MPESHETDYSGPQRYVLLNPVYVVRVGGDECVPGTLKYAFTSPAIAKLQGVKLGPYGYQAEPEPRPAILDSETSEIFLLDRHDTIILDAGPVDLHELRERALAKLTDEEKEILGLVHGPD